MSDLRKSITKRLSKHLSGARKTTLEEMAFDDQTIGDARLSLRNAEERILLAKQQLEEATNKYVFDGEGMESFVEGTLKAVPNNIPRDGTFERFDGVKAPWRKLVTRLRQDVLDATNEAEGWSPLLSVSGMKVEHSPNRSATGGGFFRVKAIVNVSPELLLLTQLRCSAQGVLDPTLIVMKEHHTFGDRKTTLRHSIRNVGPAPFRKRDHVDLTTWNREDDGTIVYASTSVPKALPANVVDKWYSLTSSVIRADQAIFGMTIRQVEVKPKGLASLLRSSSAEPKIATEVTIVSQMDWNGNVPQVWVDWKNRTGLVDYLKRAEQLCDEWVKQGVADAMVAKFLPAEE